MKGWWVLLFEKYLRSPWQKGQVAQDICKPSPLISEWSEGPGIKFLLIVLYDKTSHLLSQ